MFYVFFKHLDLQEQQQSIVGHIGNLCTSSSRAPFTSDEQSIYFPIMNHIYSPLPSMLHATSQIFSTNTPNLSTTTTTTTTTTINSSTKLQIPNSLSLYNNDHFLSLSSSSSSVVQTSLTESPMSTTTVENEKKKLDEEITSSHIFSSANSFFSNGHTGKCK